MQTLIVAMIVIGCAGYATWTLMPAAARRPLATALLRLPLPLSAGLSARLERAARATSGCGCDGCDHAPTRSAARPAAAAQQPTPQVVRFHPRPRR